MVEEPVGNCTCKAAEGRKWIRSCPIHGIEDAPGEMRLNEVRDMKLRIEAEIVRSLRVQGKDASGFSVSDIATDVFERLRPYLRTTEPVSVEVSLAAMADIVADKYNNDGMERDVAKAVLDAAGVKYVD